MIPSCLVLYQHSSELGRCIFLRVSDTTSFYLLYLTNFSVSNTFAHNHFLILHSSYNTLTSCWHNIWSPHLPWMFSSRSSPESSNPKAKSKYRSMLFQIQKHPQTSPFIFWGYKPLHHQKEHQWNWYTLVQRAGATSRFRWCHVTC